MLFSVQKSEQISRLLEPIYGFLQAKTPQAWLDVAKTPSWLPILLIDHLHCELKAAQSAALLLRKYVLDSADSEALLGWLMPYEDAAYRKQPLKGVGAGQIPRFKQPTSSAWQARLLDRMVLLMKEELHHFTQVYQLIEKRGLQIQPVAASRYAASLLSHVRTYEPAQLIDKLIIGALIEARSCERFAALAPYLDEELASFYLSLLRSEARHFEDYLLLAREVAEQAEQCQNLNDEQQLSLKASQKQNQKQNQKQSYKNMHLAKTFDARIAFFVEKEAALILNNDTQMRFHSGVPVHTRVDVLQAASL